MLLASSLGTELNCSAFDLLLLESLGGGSLRGFLLLLARYESGWPWVDGAAQRTRCPFPPCSLVVYKK